MGRVDGFDFKKGRIWYGAEVTNLDSEGCKGIMIGTRQESFVFFVCDCH